MNLTPRPPAEAPEGRAGRRRAGAAHGHLQSGHGTPEEKKSSTSLPPVPLTARESHREREDLGGSGSSITSGPASARNGSGSRSGSRGLAPKEKGKPPMPKAPSPHEASSRASSSQGYSRPSSGAAAFLEMLAMDVELTSRETLEVDLQPNPLDFSAELGRAYGAVEAPQVPNCFEEVVGEMEREKDLWHEKTLALLSSLTLTTAPTSSASSTALERTVAPTSASPVQPLAGDGGAAEGGGHGEGGKGSAERLGADLVAEPCEVEPGPSLIAQAMRDAGLDPDTSLTDLASETSLAEAHELRDWRSSSKSWAKQLARRKKERCSSGRASPCSGRESPKGCDADDALS